jgi:putative intracellular protease/amidase
MPNENTFHAGLLVYPKLTQLDMTGTLRGAEPNARCTSTLIGRTADPVVSEDGLPITPTVSFSTCPALDLLIIPGGFGVNDVLLDAETLAFVKRMADSARYVASVVCRQTNSDRRASFLRDGFQFLPRPPLRPGIPSSFSSSSVA